MSHLQLSLSCGYYDRTAPLLDGRVKPEGVDLVILPTLRPGSPIGSPTADIYEASITAVLMQRRTEGGHLPISIFPRRKFTHQLLLTRKESTIARFEDFAGKKVGVLRFYEHPLGVWLRGDLSDRYGIRPAQMRWFTDAENVFPLNELKGVEVTLTPRGKTLVEILREGELDILAHEDAHRILLEHPGLRRVFPDFIDAEASLFAETGIFPSYHVLVIKEEVVRHSSWVVASLIKAFEEAKRIALDALDRDNSLLSSPWAAHLLEKQYGLLRRDMYPYGLEANRKELEMLLRYLYEQGLVSKVMPLEEIFASGDS